MPSSAKKRRAARRKKDNQFNNLSSLNAVDEDIDAGEKTSLKSHGDSSRSGSSSDNENQGDITGSSIDSTKVGDSASIMSIDCNSQVEMPPVAAHATESAINESGGESFTTCIEDETSSSHEKTDPREECVKQEFDDTAFASSPNNGAQHASDSLVVQPQFSCQKTSWKSCCGLFEVFAKADA